MAYRRRRRMPSRGAGGRFRRRRRNRKNPVAYRRAYRPRARRRYRRNRKNPLYRKNQLRGVFRFPDFQALGATALGAILVRQFSPRVTAFLPAVPFLATPVGQLITDLAVGTMLSWGATQFVGRRWGDAVMSGAVAVAALKMSDILAPPPPMPGAGMYAGEGTSIGAYMGPTRLALGQDEVAIPVEDTVDAYMGPTVV